MRHFKVVTLFDKTYLGLIQVNQVQSEVNLAHANKPVSKLNRTFQDFTKTSGIYTTYKCGDGEIRQS
jgi:hypothetical protein